MNKKLKNTNFTDMYAIDYALNNQNKKKSALNSEIFGDFLAYYTLACG